MDFTIIVPTRNSEKIANEFLLNCLSNCKYDIILIDDNSDQVINYQVDDRIKIVYNKEKKSLTELWNQGLILSETDNLIICSHKNRPKKNDFIKNEELLKSGFGLVCLCGFHFFSFNKFLCKKIGFFDEGFKTGWYEDNDTLNKLVVNDIAYYLSDEIDDLRGTSGWEGTEGINRIYYFSKWTESGDTIIQDKIDLNYEKISFFDSLNYNIEYKKNSESVHNIIGYKRFIKFIKNE